MSKPLIIIADTDELYLQNLERKFLEEFDDQIELEIISDPVYFEQRFETPVSVEILAVSEALYSTGLQRHNISNLCVLAEEQENGSTEDLSVNRVYKYLGIRELFNELTYQSRDRLTESQTQEHKTQIISFYSAIGGTGKTALSVGLARCLSEKHKRVFYVNTESVQDFSYYLENKTGMPNEGYRVMKNEQEHMYQNVRFTLRKEGFTYLPPFKSTLDARNLDFTIYRKLIQSAKDSGDYDFIIVDVEAGYSRWRIQLLQDSDKVMLITLQDDVSTNKMRYITECLDFGDHEKYMVICNKYSETRDNQYVQSGLQSEFSIREYIDEVSTPLLTARQLAQLNGIEKVSYMFN